MAFAVCAKTSLVARPHPGTNARSVCRVQRNSAVICSSSAQSSVTTVKTPEASVDALSSVTELNVDSWDEFMQEAGDVPVVVDFYAGWCGPCKLIYPHYEAMSDQIDTMKFAKINCEKNERRFFSGLGIRALPTFHIYKNQQKVGEYTGGKMSDLKKLVQSWM